MAAIGTKRTWQFCLGLSDNSGQGPILAYFLYSFYESLRLFVGVNIYRQVARFAS